MSRAMLVLFIFLHGLLNQHTSGNVILENQHSIEENPHLLCQIIYGLKDFCQNVTLVGAIEDCRNTLYQARNWSKQFDIECEEEIVSTTVIGYEVGTTTTMTNTHHFSTNESANIVQILIIILVICVIGIGILTYFICSRRQTIRQPINFEMI